MKSDFITLYLGDCMDVLKDIPDKTFDLAIVDPPYFSGPERRMFYGRRISNIGVKRLYENSKHLFRRSLAMLSSIQYISKSNQDMQQKIYIQFEDKLVVYETFMNDLSARVASLMKSYTNDPEFVSQRKAYKIFGRSNIERWRHEGKIKPCKRPGKIEYRTAELRMLQAVIQDYF